MPASESPRPGTSETMSGRVIQPSAAARQTSATRRSRGDMGPVGRGRSPSGVGSMRKESRVSIAQASGSSTSAAGRPTAIHSAKPITTPCASAM